MSMIHHGLEHELCLEFVSICIFDLQKSKFHCFKKVKKTICDLYVFPRANAVQVRDRWDFNGQTYWDPVNSSWVYEFESWAPV